MRKTKIITIVSEPGKENRDTGKRYLITEMPSSAGERWGVRAGMAMLHAMPELPQDPQGMGLANIAKIGFQMFAGANTLEVQALMDELMDYVQILPTAGNDTFARKLLEEDIEEISTRMLLKGEAFELLTGFSIAANLSKVSKAGAALALNLQNTETSPSSSVQ